MQNYHSMLDHHTLGQLQAVMAELESTGVGSQQQDMLASQGQALHTLSRMDPHVMQQLMASDPQLQVGHWKLVNFTSPT